MKKYLIVFSLVLSFVSFGQNIRLISPDDIPGIQVIRSDSFTGQNLNKYTGANEKLYFEYGFTKMYVSEYSLQNDKARLEVFIMDDAPSAFGIYSVSITSCLIWNLYSTFSCVNSNKVSAASGYLFINAINLGKSGSGRGLCEQIVQQIIKKNPQESWYIPPLFQQPKLSPFINTLKYIEGPNGLATGAPQLIDILENIQFSLYSVNIMTPAYAGILVRIVFPDFNTMDSFLVQAGLNTSEGATPNMSMNGAYRSWYKIEDTKLVYLECSSPDLKLSDILPGKPNPMW